MEATGSEIPTVAAEPGRAERLALHLLRIGAVAVVLLAVTYREFDLDRFFVPKELVLHASALAAGILLLGALDRFVPVRVDLLLLAYLALSAFSAVFATNPWVAIRALTLTASGVLLFWIGRILRERGLARPLLVAIAAAIVAGAAGSLLQAYGVETELFSVNRSPGGTLGNRNFVAHMAAFGIPLVLMCALRAWRPLGFLLGAVGVVLVAATLVLTRSRAGWLAFAAAGGVFLFAMVASPRLRRHTRTWLRLGGIVLLGAAGVVAAVYLPNDLNWRSENPYLESMQGLANYQEGSGRGRLVQYARSLRMTADNPVLGVGPGNWPVRYPEYAAADDPSLDASAPGMTSNPWPSSDWVAFVSERGVPGAILLALAMAGIAAASVRRILGARDADEGLQSTALLAMTVAAIVAGLFDAVLLLALPAFIVWLALGLLWPPGAGRPLGASRAVTRTVVAFLLLVVAFGVFRSASQLVSMAAYTKAESRETLRWAARVDPGNYRLRLRLGQGGGSREDRCEHALAARALFPNARAARNAAEGCAE